LTPSVHFRTNVGGTPHLQAGQRPQGDCAILGNLG
jgi:hypothetical protein